MEYQGADGDIAAFRSAADRTCRELALIHDPEFTDDPAAQADLWKLRKGMIPALGAMRRPGTTILIEDIVFPVPRLADGVTDLQRLFHVHGYEDAIIFGHAKDGNLHFVMSQSFNTSGEVRRFEGFMGDLVRVVSGKYDGALKAEHGTGRNMAPFLETEWGAHARAIMGDLKQLFDPDGILSPGVIINADPRAHVTHLKSLPSGRVRGRQVHRVRILRVALPKPPHYADAAPAHRRAPRDRPPAHGLSALRPQLASLTEDYDYYGVETCAADGLCATSCPVGINTGDLTKRLRAEKVGPKGHAGRACGWRSISARPKPRCASRCGLGHAAESVLGAARFGPLTRGAETVVPHTLPKWNSAVQHVPGACRAPSLRGRPTSISRRAYRAPWVCRPAAQPSLADTLCRDRPTRRGAGVDPRRCERALLRHALRFDRVPGCVQGHAAPDPGPSCGDGHSKEELPVVIDMTSCAYTLRTCRDVLARAGPRPCGRS